MTKRIADPACFLAETGLLFEINRAVLHPLGLALEVVVEDDGQMRIGGLWDQQGEPGGIVFDEESFQDGARKLAAFMSIGGETRQQVRKDMLGFVVQEEPEP
jgi:hypothetical protein